MKKRILFVLWALFGWLIDWDLEEAHPPICRTEDIPKPGEREHVDGPGCWCKPTLFFDGGDEFGSVWVHKGDGDEMPPSDVLASAVADAISGHAEDRYFPPKKTD